MSADADSIRRGLLRTLSDDLDPQLAELRQIWERLDDQTRKELISFGHYLELKSAD